MARETAIEQRIRNNVHATIAVPLRGEILELINLTSGEKVVNILSTDNTAALYKLVLGNVALPTRTILRLTTRVHSNIVAEIGRSDQINLDEASTLDYIHSRIPYVLAPKCLGAIRLQGYVFLFMTRAKGVRLKSVWKSLSDSAKNSVQTQLISALRNLRELKREGENMQLGHCVTGVCKEKNRNILHKADEKCYKEGHFNDFLFEDVPDSSSTSSRWPNMLKNSMSEDHAIKFSHSHISPSNFMVHVLERGDGCVERVCVSAIVGLELAGWYPGYWEFVQAMHLTENAEHKDCMDYLPTMAIGTYMTEYAKNLMRTRRIGSC